MSNPTSAKHMFHRIQLLEGKFCEIGHVEYGAERGGGEALLIYSLPRVSK